MTLEDKPIHSCVNLFWNPLNRTFDAFQRNGLLRAIENADPEHALLCILELDVERILIEFGAYWTATKLNAASNAFASSDISHLKEFPWTNIFAYGNYTLENSWQARAAELIVFHGSPKQKQTDPIPPSYVTRVIISSKVQITKQQQDWLWSAGLPCHRSDVFKSVSALLRSEKYFIENVMKYHQADKDSLIRLVAAFRILIEFEAKFGGPTSDRFVSPSIAHGPHGTGHHTRVMFWTAFLATYPFGLIGTNRHNAAIVAALLHDLGRQKEGEDQGHGERVLEKNYRLIERVLDDQILRESCASAVQMHGIDDSKCPVERRDPLWELLKDADGLERGRFERPIDPTRRPTDLPKGCDPSILRFGYLNNATSAKEYIPYLAYQLAGITKYSLWDDRPCYRLLTDFISGLTQALAHGLFRDERLSIVQSLHKELSTLHKKHSNSLTPNFDVIRVNCDEISSPKEISLPLTTNFNRETNIIHDYDVDEDKYGYDDDEKFYRETVYNEWYYIELENEWIRRAHLELEFEGQEDSHDWDIDDDDI
ncbi:MAG: hypothetical protein J2P31_00615 [Blastocatellia bacterium]|nr:hypothetical protein [Blastocatellia bacterium]